MQASHRYTSTTINNINWMTEWHERWPGFWGDGGESTEVITDALLLLLCYMIRSTLWHQPASNCTSSHNVSCVWCDICIFLLLFYTITAIIIIIVEITACVLYLYISDNILMSSHSKWTFYQIIWWTISQVARLDNDFFFLYFYFCWFFSLSYCMLFCFYIDKIATVSFVYAIRNYFPNDVVVCV